MHTHSIKDLCTFLPPRSAGRRQYTCVLRSGDLYSKRPIAWDMVMDVEVLSKHGSLCKHWGGRQHKRMISTAEYKECQITR